MKRPVRLVVALLAVLGFAAPAVADQSADGAPATTSESGYVFVTFSSPAAASYEGGIPGLARTKPANGRLDPNSPAYRAYVRHLDDEHANFRAFLRDNAPRAQVVREYRTVLNGMAVKLNGHGSSVLRGGPGVRTVTPSTLYRLAMNVSPELIRATEVWPRLGGAPNAGAGIRVAVIDSGIDLTNPFFDDSGLPAQSQIDRCDDQDDVAATPDTNDKVVVCRVFHSGVTTGSPSDGLPELCNDHGTHVAGTIGGRHGTDGVVAGTDVVLQDLSGVAPGVVLGNYNVFPCIGAGWTAYGGSAFSHDIAAAIEQAVLDGMDVANMSLGGKVQGPHDLLAEAADAAVDAGMVMVIAAGNSGPGDATVESPGSAENAITAGASTNPHFVGVPVTADPDGAAGVRTIGGAVGEFDPFTTPVTGVPYTVTTPANGCTAIAEDLTGKIALIDRGTCTFGNKIANAEAAGAVGVIVVNNVAGDPTAMAADPLFETSIPAVMVGKDEGNALKPSGVVSIDGTNQQEFFTDNADILAGFSGRGPTPFTYLVKPDLTAPGVNVASSVFGGELAFFQGTSMATPHLSGVAALLLDEYPGASPAEVKSRMANNAARVVTDHVTGTTDPGPLARGGGRVDVVRAFRADSWFDPVSVSFGLVRGNRPFDETRTVAVHGAPATGAEVVWFSSQPAGLSVTATTSGDAVTVRMSMGRGVPSGDYSGDIRVTTADGDSYLVPFWVRVTQR